VLCSISCIAYNEYMQYTIRNVPDNLDAALRGSAREQGKSLNDVAIEALARGAGLSESRRRRRDLRDVAGTWIEDPAFASALAEQAHPDIAGGGVLKS
jgi:plasmid stability protein